MLSIIFYNSLPRQPRLALLLLVGEITGGVNGGLALVGLIALAAGFCGFAPESKVAREIAMLLRNTQLLCHTRLL